MTTGNDTLRPDRLRIRQAEPSDFEAVLATIASPRACRGTLQLPMPSLARWRERMAAFDQPDTVLLVAEVRDETALPRSFDLVGHASLQPTGKSPRRRHAVGLGMSVRDDWQGRGIGSALMRALIERADQWMNVLRIELTVFVDNDAAIALYGRHGFVVEGTHRAYALREGRYVDAFAMARLHPLPPALPTLRTETG